LVNYMNRTRKLLDELVSGKITVDEAEKQLKTLTLDSIGGLAMIDVDRGSRSGIPEIIFGESKDAKEIVQIVKGMLKNQDAVLVTRLTQEKLDFLFTSIKDAEIEAFGKKPILTALVSSSGWSVNETAGKIAVITAGTSDIPYAKKRRLLQNLWESKYLATMM